MTIVGSSEGLSEPTSTTCSAPSSNSPSKNDFIRAPSRRRPELEARTTTEHSRRTTGRPRADQKRRRDDPPGRAHAPIPKRRANRQHRFMNSRGRFVAEIDRQAQSSRDPAPVVWRKSPRPRDRAKSRPRQSPRLSARRTRSSNAGLTAPRNRSRPLIATTGTSRSYFAFNAGSALTSIVSIASGNRF